MMQEYRGKVMFLAGFVAALSAGWIGFPKALYQSARQPVQFSHRVHSGAKTGLKCEDCHSFRDDGSFTGILFSQEGA